MKAAGLGAGTMSVYRYIDGKGDLVALMADALAAEVLVPDGELPADWRAALALIAHRTRAAYLRHPWAVHALHGEAAAGKGAPMGPNGLRRFEQSLAALASAPFDTAGRLSLLTLTDDYVYGHLLRAAELQARARARPHRGPSDRRRGDRRGDGRARRRRRLLVRADRGGRHARQAARTGARRADLSRALPRTTRAAAELAATRTRRGPAP